MFEMLEILCNLIIRDNTYTSLETMTPPWKLLARQTKRFDQLYFIRNDN